MEHGSQQARNDNSEASVHQDQESQNEHVHEEQAPIDPMRQLQEAMIEMARNQARYFGGLPVQQAPAQGTVVDVNTSLFKSFKAMDPPSFTGTKGEEDAENWMNKICQIFNIMGVADEDKLKLAVFMLSEEAYHWWVSAERVLTTVPTANVQVTWRNFQEAFNEKYFSSYYQS